MTRPRLVLVDAESGADGSDLAARYVAEHPGVVRLEPDGIASAHLAAGHDVLVPVVDALPDQRELFRTVAAAAGADFVELRVESGADPSESLRRLVAAVTAGDSGVDRSIDQPVSRLLTWSEVATRLAAERTFWLSTTNPDGSPQVAPVWGVVVEETLFVYSERTTAKARNLARDPRVAVHLADPDDVLIVHGSLDDLGRPGSRPDVVEAFRAAYVDPGDAAYLPDADPAFDVLWALRPTRALTWLLEGFEDSRRRWSRP